MLDTSVRSSELCGPAVWDRLWRYRPPEARDDALLARERRSLRWSVIVEKLEATFGSIEGLETIELGSGRGDLSVLLARRGARVTLLDASERALDQSKHRFGRLGLTARFERGDLLGDLDRWHERYDVALSSGLVEHFTDTDRTRVVRSHYEVLKPGGVAIISVPNAWCAPYRMWKLYLELRGWWPYGLELPFTSRELARRARVAGFVRSEVRCMSFWQSVGDHLGKTLFGRGPDWVDRPSRFDAALGFVLLLTGWRAS